MSLTKNARKKAVDPKQEALRETKDSWNKNISKFITLLIALKKGINGREVPALNIPQNSITEPLPPSVPILLDQMAGAFNKLTEEGHNIVHQQADYAGTRKAASLNKQGANIFTRLWAYISPIHSPRQYLKDEERGIRIDMLKSAAFLNRRLRNIESELVDRGANTIPESLHLVKDFFHIFESSIVKPLETMHRKRNLPKKPGAEERLEQLEKGEEPVIIPEEDIETKLEIPEEKTGLSFDEMVSEANTYNENFSKFYPILDKVLLDKSVRVQFKNTVMLFNKAMAVFTTAKTAKDIDKMNVSFEELKNLYQKIEKVFNLTTEAGINNDELIKLSQLRVKTYLLNKWLSIWRTRDSSLRQDAVGTVQKIYNYLDKVMNELQKENPTLSVLKSNIENIMIYLSALLETMLSLADMHNNRARILGLKKKDSDIKPIPTTIFFEIRRMIRELNERLQV